VKTSADLRKLADARDLISKAGDLFVLARRVEALEHTLERIGKDITHAEPVAAAFARRVLDELSE
jgi:hypothetical protein